MLRGSHSPFDNDLSLLGFVFDEEKEKEMMEEETCDNEIVLEFIVSDNNLRRLPITNEDLEKYASVTDFASMLDCFIQEEKLTTHVRHTLARAKMKLTPEQGLVFRPVNANDIVNSISLPDTLSYSAFKQLLAYRDGESIRQLAEAIAWLVHYYCPPKERCVVPDHTCRRVGITQQVPFADTTKLISLLQQRHIPTTTHSEGNVTVLEYDITEAEIMGVDLELVKAYVNSLLPKGLIELGEVTRFALSFDKGRTEDSYAEYASEKLKEEQISTQINTILNKHLPQEETK